MDTHQHFIGGDWVPGQASLRVVNPSDGQVMAEIARGGAAEIDRAVRAARAAMDGEWGRMDAMTRGRLLLRLSELIRRDAEALAKMESEDVGKPLSLARSDVTVCARYFEHHGGAADKVHGDTIPYQNGFTVMTVYEPHGVVGVIVPWSYPLQMTGRSVAPALAMGNAVVLKPAEDTSLTALALARLTEEAGFPKGALNVVTGLEEEALGRAMRLSRKVKSGQVFVNNYGAGGGVELPFGGVKGSGHGREKGFEALYGFGAMKMIAIKHGS